MDPPVDTTPVNPTPQTPDTTPVDPGPTPTIDPVREPERTFTRPRRQTRTLADALARRVLVGVRCTRRCKLTGTLTFSARTARKLGLRSRTVGTLRAHGRGRVTLPVRLSKPAARALRQHPRTVLITVPITDGRSNTLVQNIRLTLTRTR